MKYIFSDLFILIRNKLNLIKKKISGTYLTTKPIGSTSDYLRIFELAKKKIILKLLKLKWILVLK